MRPFLIVFTCSASNVAWWTILGLKVILEV